MAGPESDYLKRKAASDNTPETSDLSTEDADRGLLLPESVGITLGGTVGGASPALNRPGVTSAPAGGSSYLARKGQSTLQRVGASANPDMVSNFSVYPAGDSAAIPLGIVDEREAAKAWLNTLQLGESQNPWLASEILTHVRSLEMAPEVAYTNRNPATLQRYVLDNPDVVDEYLVQVWTYMLDGLIGSVDEQGEYQYPALVANLDRDMSIKEWERQGLPRGGMNDPGVTGEVLGGAAKSTLPGYTPLAVNPNYSNQQQFEAVGAFTDRHSPKFSPEEWEFLLTIFSAVPNTYRMLSENDKIVYYGNEDDNWFMRRVNDLRTGISMLGNEPAVLATSMNDPVFNLVAQLDRYLVDNDISDLAKRQEFFMMAMGKTQEEADRINRIRGGGFDELAERTVNIGINTNKYLVQQGLLNLPATAPRDPEEYLWKDGLTNGQVLMTQFGVNPSDELAWKMGTGAVDAYLDIGLDVLTWTGGVGAGARNIARVPRTMTRSQAIKTMLSTPIPFRDVGKLGFGVLDRGLIPRAMWAFGSKGIDEFTDTRQAWRAWRWMAKTTSKSDMVSRFPSLVNAPPEQLNKLVDAADPMEVQAIWRGWMTGTDPSTFKSAQGSIKDIHALHAATEAYQNARYKSIQQGIANIRGFNKADDNVDEVLEPVGIVEQYVYEAARKGATRTPAGTPTMEGLGARVATTGEKFYHGSGGTISEGNLSFGGRSADNLFGPGFYTTGDPKVAGGYAARGAAQEVSEVVWKGPGKPRVINFDDAASSEVRNVFRGIVNESNRAFDDVDVDAWDNIVGLLDNPNATGAEIYKAVKESLAGQEKYVVDEVLEILNDSLSQIADAIKHQGGVRTGGVLHDVHIWLNPEDIVKTGNYRASGLEPDSAQRIIDEAAGEGTAVFRKSQWTGQGGKRAVVSNIRERNLESLDLNDATVRANVIEWLDNDNNTVKGAKELAAAIELNQSVDTLSPMGIDILREYLQQAGAGSFKQGDLRVIGRNSDPYIFHGIDTAEELAPSAIHADLATEVRRADEKAFRLRDTINKNIFVTIDIPRTYISTRWQMRLAKMGRNLPNHRYIRGMRRNNFQLGHALPTNISLTDGGRGGMALKNWLKMLGGSPEMAQRWADEFIDADMTRRKGIMERAFMALGEESGNLLLKNDLIDFITKQGHVTYALGGNGQDIGRTARGNILPMTITHLTNDIAMPQAKEMVRMMRRYEGAAKKGSIRLRAGVVNFKGHGAAARRGKIVKQLQNKMIKRGVDPKSIDPDDWLTIGYADTLASVTGRSRPDAMGAVNQSMRILASPYRALHGAFVVSQLALRPFAWSGRVLMEEGIRSDLMGLPSLWANPREYIGLVMDSRAIYKLSDDITAQAKYIDKQIAAKLFSDGLPDWGEIKKIVPNIDELMEQNNVAGTQFNRVKALVAHEMGRSLIGGEAATNAQLGSRYNPFRRSALRQRRIGRAHRRLDDAGLLPSFRWQEDGKEIANRTFWQTFVSELSSGFIDMEWKAGKMTEDSLKAYGRGYARTIFQMLGTDPLVRKYGLKRMLAHLDGDSVSGAGRYEGVDAVSLMQDPNWQKIRPKITEKMIEDGTPMTEAEEAQWYLDKVVDEIARTLIVPLAQGDVAAQRRITQGLLDRTPILIDMGDGNMHTLSMTRDNYEGFAEVMVEIADSANALGRRLPHTVSAQMDHRMGQKAADLSRWRRATDWIMQKAGEDASQALFRRAGYLSVHKRYYDYAISMGHSPEGARALAAEKAAETVNYVFFNNKAIPEFLHKMNKVIPFFSAMWEVGQTWAYKIPAHEGWPVGAAHLVRKVDRTIDALHNIGLLETNEDGQMALRLAPDDALTGPLLAAVRAPAYLAQHMVGVGRLLLDPFEFDGKVFDQYQPADLSAWMKDGFEFAVGNPLDPTSHGILAVNQLSVGPTPVIAYPLGVATKAFFAADTQVIKTEGMTVADFVTAHPDVDVAEMLYINQDVIKDKNGAEAFARANSREGDPTQLEMPDAVEMPRSSFWETMVDETIFPFGRIETPGRAITSIIPSALQHAWRGIFTAFGQEDSEIVNFLFGNMSTYQMTGEVINAMMFLEATEGVMSEVTAMTVEMLKTAEEKNVEVMRAPNEAPRILDEDAEGADEVREMIEAIRRKEEAAISRAHANAAGSMFFRALYGTIFPATPRQYEIEQERARAYWNQKEIAENARIRGDGIDPAAFLASMPAATPEDLEQALNVVKAYWEDPSGTEAKIWVRNNMPELEPYLKGKTFWAEDGMPVEAESMDRWADQLQDGLIQPFDPEVWWSRQQRAAIATSKDVAIKLEYGGNPNEMAQTILMDQARYDEIVDPFNMEYEALGFIDAEMFDSKYEVWRDSQDRDELSQMSMTRDKLRFYKDSADATIDMLQYMDLTPQERREMEGKLRAGNRELSAGIEYMDQREEQDGNPWRSPHEKILDRYWEEVAGPYWEDRTRIFEEFVDTAAFSWERGAAFDRIRDLENEHFFTRHQVEGYNGEMVEVPNDLVRSWNRLRQQDRQERILAMMDKNPEWLNQFQISVLVDASPKMAQVLPSDPAVLREYQVASEQIRRLLESHYRNPDALPESQVEKQVGEIKDRRDQNLMRMGRRQEVEYRESWVPAEQLEWAGLLPQSLVGAMPQLRAVLNRLRAQEMSPTTNEGEKLMIKFRKWLTEPGGYFDQVPGSREDFDELGKAMFGETFESTVHARLWQGDRFGKLE